MNCALDRRGVVEFLYLLRVILADPQKAYWGIGLPYGYTLGRVLGFGNIGLWWRFAIALAVAAGVLTWRFSKMVLHGGERPHQK